MAELFRDLAVARADGSIGTLPAKLARTDVLVLDDFAMAPMKDSERRDFLEICDDRYQRCAADVRADVDIVRLLGVNYESGDISHPLDVDVLPDEQYLRSA